ncbi:MAG TPA: RHS repeat-associated core domain-containing protein [Terriglobia bacterium]|nr:RHS repeat-associated core domain-containing protein [Terriglobia bacterium]
MIRLLDAFLELVRRENRFIVTQWDVDSGEIRRFAFVAERTGPALTLVGIEDVSGDGLELTWDASGRLGKLRQRIENRTVMVSYSPAGRITSLALVTNGGAKTPLVRYEYDESGRLSAAFDRRGLANRYEYDAHSRITREMLKDGAVYSYKYDEKGRCIRFSGLDHYNEKRLQFLDTARTTIVTNSYGKSSVYQYLPGGQIASEADPSGNKQSTIFDEYNRIVAKVDATGATTRYTYDEHGNRDSITDPLGNTYRFAFNAHHQPVSVTNPLGKTWLREYDTRHRLIAAQDPLGARWKVAHDAAGSPAVITDPMGSTRWLTYADGLVREMTDWMGHPTRFAWDEFGRVTERIGPVGERTAFRYDQAGNPVEVELPDGGRLRATYDSGDNLSTFTNSKGQTTRFRYGSCRRLLERVDPIGRVVHYGWGTEPERLDSVINEKGETFTYFRDDLGRILRERSFDGREQNFDYDLDGHCIAFTNGNGEKIQIKRDAAGRLVEQALPDGTVTSYEYDSVGRIISAVNPDILAQFEYDDAGRLVREVQGEEWVRTEYNTAGEVIRTQTSLGHQVRYELDPNGRVRKLHTGNNHSLAFERDARGRETGRQMPGSVRIEQRFDPMGRLLEQRVGRALSAPGREPTLAQESRIPAGHEVIKRDYRYDADGLLLSIKDDRWGATDYAYDPAERLLSALCDRGLNEHFEYDITDNLTRSQQQDRESRRDHSLAYGPGNRLLQRADTRYEYDLDGRLVRKTEGASSEKPQVWEYTWDAEGQLRKLCRPEGVLWEYKYDAFGRRVAKIGLNSIRRFLWNGNVIIHEKSNHEQSVAWLMERGSFAPLGKVQDGDLFPVIYDQIGTAREMLDSSGKLVWESSPTAWGQNERNQKPRSEHECPIRFQGQWFDEESGLHYNRFRYYDPADARFISPDPTRLTSGNNLFKYVQNPTTWIDPYGLASKPCAASELPEMKGMGAEEREATLVAAGFTLDKVSNSPAKNETWSHPDGSEVRVHPYGDVKNGPYPSGNNAHIHKEDPAGNQLTDRGIVSTNKADTHIGLPNPSDLPQVRGRPHGV